MPLQMAKQLISSGADVDAIDEEGNTALMLSVVCEHLVSHSSHFIGVCCAVLWCVICCAVLCCAVLCCAVCYALCCTVMICAL
jgi:preprotein translocase subunit SecY